MISLSHQQVGFSNVAPRHVENNPSGEEEEEEEESLLGIIKTRKAIPELGGGSSGSLTALASGLVWPRGWKSASCFSSYGTGTSVPGAAKIARACDARGKEEEEEEFIQNQTGFGGVCDLVSNASTRMATSASSAILRGTVKAQRVACLFNMFIGDAPNKDHPIQQRTTTRGLLAGGY